MCGFSPFRRTTPKAAYKEGYQFISEIQFILAKSGRDFKTDISDYYRKNAGQSIDTSSFLNWIQSLVPKEDLSGKFDRYVYGKK